MPIMSENEYRVFMDLEAVASYLGVSMSTIYRYINSKENPLPSFKISSSKIVVKRVELDEWITDYRKSQIVI